MTDRASPALDPDLLEKLRRGLKLRVRASGALEIGGEPVTHPNVARVIRAGLDLNARDEPILVLGEQWAYVEIEDAAFRVLAVIVEGDRLLARLDDARTVEVDPATLVEDAGRGLRCQVPARHSGRPMRARFTNTAQMDLAPRLEPDGPGTSVLLGGRAWPVRPGP